MTETELAFSPACERNKDPILQVLREQLPEHGRVLEIGSGTGQHAVHFAAALPGIAWQPSDRKDDLHWWHSLNQRIRDSRLPNLQLPLALDVLDSPTLVNASYDAVFSANTSHIMHWRAVQAMFGLVGTLLKTGGPFILYGPFNRDGQYTSASNRDFDTSLRARDPGMGLRDINDLQGLGLENELELETALSMPANNQILVFRRISNLR